MLITNTKLTGYSLGLPLWISPGDTRLSTGILQGISLTLSGNYTDVFLTKYSRQNNRVGLTFSTNDEILCSLAAELSAAPQTFPLVAESSRFIAGYVTLFDVGGVEELDLSGAQVCPKYIQFVDNTSVQRGQLILISADSTDDNVSSETVAFEDLGVEDSTDVSFTASENNTSVTYTATATTDNGLGLPDDGNNYIYSVNGSAVVSGTVLIDVSNSRWVVRGNAYSAKIGLLTDIKSCPDENYIEAKLNPGNYAKSCPLDLAFTDNTLNMDNVYQTRFNTEYDGCSGGVCSGLAWDEFSTQHDMF